MKENIDQKIQAFFQKFPAKSYPKGEVVLHAGARGNLFFFVETGSIKMMITSAQGQNLVLHIFHSDSCFPLLNLVNDKNIYDFVTMVPSTIRTVPQQELVSFLHENVDVLFEFQLRLLKGLQGLLHRTEQTAFVPAYKRVANLLLYFARHFSEHSASDAQKMIEIHITHQEISEWLGLSRENVSIHMKQLEHEGFIRKKENLVEIMDIEKLRKFANPYQVS